MLRDQSYESPSAAYYGNIIHSLGVTKLTGSNEAWYDKCESEMHYMVMSGKVCQPYK